MPAPRTRPQATANASTGVAKAQAGRGPLQQAYWPYLAASLVLLIPCYWQAHIQAGDLSSHIYNTWLTQVLESKPVPGLEIVHPTTNVLFDLMLAGLYRLAGPEVAQRLAVSAAVLVFGWGAFAWVTTASGRPAWPMAGSIAMLAYGWVFHMGFLNFYLSLGLCFWGMALVWQGGRRKLALAAAIFVLAYTAHALPLAWALGLGVYAWLARRWGPGSMGWLTAGAVGIMITAHVVLAHLYLTRWDANQLELVTGADQVRVFDEKYRLIFDVLLVIWAVLAWQLLRRQGARQVALSLPAQFCVLGVAAVFVLPTAVQFPGYRHLLVYIAHRLSLAVGISACALLAAAPPRALARYAQLALALVFFGFLYRDERILNNVEDLLTDAVHQLPAGSRVLSGVADPALRINTWAHVIDRACLGHCYSYANYEPSTWQFRLRATAPNPYVAFRIEDSWKLQTGSYVVRPEDVPLYQVTLDPLGRIAVRSLAVGETCRIENWKTLPDLLGGV